MATAVSVQRDADNVRFVALDRQHDPIKRDLQAAFDRLLGSSAFTLGAELERFEAEFADYCDVGHCVGVSSGTAALSLMFRAHGIGPGDEVIVPGHTFIASALAVAHVGATPVLCDVDEGTGLIDPDAARAAVGPRTAAVLAVHLYGQACDMAAIEAFAKPRGLLVFEDAAQAHGARYQGRRVGSLGTASAFSFYPTKNLGALGDGGAVCTEDDVIAARIRRLRNLGQRAKGEHVELGYNERLDGLQAALLRVKLQHLDEWNAGTASARCALSRVASVGTRNCCASAKTVRASSTSSRRDSMIATASRPRFAPIGSSRLCTMPRPSTLTRRGLACVCVTATCRSPMPGQPRSYRSPCIQTFDPRRSNAWPRRFTRRSPKTQPRARGHDADANRRVYFSPGATCRASCRRGCDRPGVLGAKSTARNCRESRCRGALDLRSRPGTSGEAPAADPFRARDHTRRACPQRPERRSCADRNACAYPLRPCSAKRSRRASTCSWRSHWRPQASWRTTLRRSPETGAGSSCAVTHSSTARRCER